MITTADKIWLLVLVTGTLLLGQQAYATYPEPEWRTHVGMLCFNTAALCCMQLVVRRWP